MKDSPDRTKVVLRHLPPAISQAMLMDQIDSVFAGRYHWVTFRPGKSRWSFAFFGLFSRGWTLLFYQWFCFGTLWFWIKLATGNVNVYVHVNIHVCILVNGFGTNGLGFVGSFGYPLIDPWVCWGFRTKSIFSVGLFDVLRFVGFVCFPFFFFGEEEWGATLHLPYDIDIQVAVVSFLWFKQVICSRPSHVFVVSCNGFAAWSINPTLEPTLTSRNLRMLLSLLSSSMVICLLMRRVNFVHIFWRDWLGRAMLLPELSFYFHLGFNSDGG